MATASRILQVVLLVLALFLGSAWPLCAQTLMPTTAPLASWTSVACSADGEHLVAAAGTVYFSTNGGSSWVSVLLPNSVSSANCSVDGKVFVAVDGIQTVY